MNDLLRKLDEALRPIEDAAAAGDEGAKAWLRGEGKIVVVKKRGGVFSARFIRWEHLDGRTSPRALEWSRAVMTRDGFKCVECGKKGKLQAHHLKEWADYPELRFEVSNGVTLCVDCHCLKHPGYENLIRKSNFRGKRKHAVA